MTAIADEDLVLGSEHNYVATWADLVPEIGGERGDLPGVVLTSTGLPVGALNSAFVVATPADSAATIEAIDTWFRPRGVPYTVRWREAVAPGLAAAGAAAGLAPSEPVPVLAMHPIPQSPPAPAGLEIREARDDTDFDDHRTVVTLGFGMPREMTEHAFPTSVLRAQARVFVGYVDGEAVSTAALIAKGGVAGVYSVATIESHRGRGLGAALTWRAVAAGTEASCAFASLQASPMGRPVYERMGFRLVSTYEALVSPPA